VLARQCRTCQVFLIRTQGLFGALAPGRRLLAMMLEIFLELFFTCHRIDDTFFGDANIVLHLADDLFDHPFGVFDPVDQIVQVGRQDIANTLKNIRHTALRLLLRSC
jgi:hypothetical protein